MLFFANARRTKIDFLMYKTRNMHGHSATHLLTSKRMSPFCGSFNTSWTLAHGDEAARENNF